MVKQLNDNGRYIFIIEPIDDEAEVLIKKIREICGLTAPGTEIKGLTPPPITVPEKIEKPVTVQIQKKEEKSEAKDEHQGVGKGWLQYHEAVMKIKKGLITGAEREPLLNSIVAFAEKMKTITPTGATLRYFIENLSEMTSERVENYVLDSMHISKKQLLDSTDESLLAEAYKLAVNVPAKK